MQLNFKTQISDTWKKILIGLGIFLGVVILVLLIIWITLQVNGGSISKLEKEKAKLRADLVENQIKRAIELESYEITKKENIRSAQIIDSLIKNKPKIKPIQYAPINYTLPSSVQDSLYSINYNRFRKGGI